jgi:hypothetical protein
MYEKKFLRYIKQASTRYAGPDLDVLADNYRKRMAAFSSAKQTMIQEGWELSKNGMRPLDVPAKRKLVKLRTKLRSAAATITDSFSNKVIAEQIHGAQAGSIEGVRAIVIVDRMKNRVLKAAGVAKNALLWASMSVVGASLVVAGIAGVDSNLMHQHNRAMMWAVAGAFALASLAGVSKLVHYIADLSIKNRESILGEAVRFSNKPVTNQ